MRCGTKVFMFVNYTPADGTIGITKKIRSEIVALRKMGCNVTYTAYVSDGISVFNNDDAVIFHKKYPTSSCSLNRKIRYFWLEKVALAFLQTAEHFDLGYIRMCAPNKAFFKILKELKKRKCQIIGEAHGYFPGIRYRSLGGKYISWAYHLHRNEFKRYFEYFLVEGHFSKMYDVPAYTTNVGVDVATITMHKYAGASDELNMISVSNEMDYHGYDRLIKSLWVYKQNNPEAKIFIHLVGTISEKTKQLINKYLLEESVIFYGKRSRAELDNIYNKCNVGLGPFGQHRVGGKKDTGLKTKEYFAKGLPYIYSGDEPTVPENYPYICQFPADESLIDFDRVWEFYDNYRNDPLVVQNMRAFAAEQYSWDTIMKDALGHLN